MVACASMASASATLFLEEPYGKLGFFTATGHAAVYLSDVCADSPVVLRRCAAGETGVVLSRYDGVAGYDWLAIPLVPYLYAVERPEDVPLFADAKIVAFLRDQYRRKYLEEIAPDGSDGKAPGGNWYELVGSSYDRTIYGFEIKTTPEQDAALIRELNSSSNRSHFHLASNNCADFARSIINFYYPKALHRSLVADVGITTPKQMAKMVARFGSRHPELELSRVVIEQVPGRMPRSSPVHGVVESFLKSKKYIVPSAVVSPIFAGCVFAVYIGTGAGRFEPDRNALVFDPIGDPEPPLSHQDRKAYQQRLKSFIAETGSASSEKRVGKEWEKLESKAQIAIDNQGAPVLQMHFGQKLVRVGLSPENLDSAPPELARAILEARLASELRHATPRGVSRGEVTWDWNQLQRAQKMTMEEDSLITAPSSLTMLRVAFTSAP